MPAIPTLSSLCITILYQYPLNAIPYLNAVSVVKDLPVDYNIPTDVCNNVIESHSADITPSEPALNEIHEINDDAAELNSFFVKNRYNLKVAHLNINSIRHKFLPLSNLLYKSFIDVLFLQETKVDDSFPHSQFHVKKIVLYRKDVNDHCGGLMAIVRSDLPQRRRHDLEHYETMSGRIEILIIELMLKKEKWLLCSIYKQPKVKDSEFINILEKLVGSLSINNCNYVLIGDFNINVFNDKHCLQEFFQINGLRNMVNEPTCFKSNNPTCIDLIVTNVFKRIHNVSCFDNNLSDFHNLVCFSTKFHVPKFNRHAITYRSYKHFNDDKYLYDLSTVPFHVCEIFDSVDDSYWFCSKLLKDVIDEHAPIKKRIIKHNQVPYMNSNLRKAINVRNAFKRKYDKHKLSQNWERYRKQRNLVTQLRRNSLMEYMKKKCKQNDRNGYEFWQTIKPVISDKSKMSNDIILMENNNIVNEPTKVANTLNDHFVNAANGIGKPDFITEFDDLDSIILPHKDADCIKRIRNNIYDGSHFGFTEIDEDVVLKKLLKINAKKATGYDQLPPKMIKLGAAYLSGPIKSIINQSIRTSTFPNELKAAEVTPIFKKNDRLDKGNYRPVSILPCISKIFESVYVDQLSFYFESLFAPALSGFRKSHNCQHVLIDFIEKCKNSLDNNKVYGALLTDLSRAFDCLPPKLLISKLNAYGIDSKSCMMIANYFLGRKQRVKLAHIRSDWMDIVFKGALQGSLMGPFTYNVHSNDLL